MVHAVGAGGRKLCCIPKSLSLCCVCALQTEEDYIPYPSVHEVPMPLPFTAWLFGQGVCIAAGPTRASTLLSARPPGLGLQEGLHPTLLMAAVALPRVSCCYSSKCRGGLRGSDLPRVPGKSVAEQGVELRTPQPQAGALLALAASPGSSWLGGGLVS